LKKEKEGFRVPENYFDQMQQEVLGRIKADANLTVVSGHTPIIPLYRQTRFWLKVAGFALVVAAATYVLLPDNKGGSEVYLAEFSAEEASVYINTHLDEFELEDMLEVSQLDPMELFPSENTSANDMQEEGMDQYLDEIIDDFDLEELEEIL
jgi:hypothetical protein